MATFIRVTAQPTHFLIILIRAGDTPQKGCAQCGAMQQKGNKKKKRDFILKCIGIIRIFA